MQRPADKGLITMAWNRPKAKSSLRGALAASKALMKLSLDMDRCSDGEAGHCLPSSRNEEADDDGRSAGVRRDVRLWHDFDPVGPPVVSATTVISSLLGTDGDGERVATSRIGDSCATRAVAAAVCIGILSLEAALLVLSAE